jgi:DNA polymerase-3 subunit delta'
VLDLWRDYWRDLMLIKLGHAGMITNIDREAEMMETAEGYGLGRIKDFIECIESAAANLRRNANTRLALEVLMLDIPEREGGQAVRDLSFRT